MIGLDFPVKLEWIHTVHALWQPNQSVSDLMKLALVQTMQELGGNETRRKSLTIILRYFVSTEGGGNSRTTAAQDVWVAYSHAYPASVMAPAYLVHLIAQNEVAQEVTKFILQRYDTGADLLSTDVRRYVIAQFGQRKVVTNAASAFLRTLQYFGVLESEESAGHYRYLGQLAVQREVFPLIVWAWWQTHFEPQIDIQRFEEDPALGFLATANFAASWEAYQRTFWSIEERIEGRRAVLKYADAPGFKDALLSGMR